MDRHRQLASPKQLHRHIQAAALSRKIAAIISNWVKKAPPAGAAAAEKWSLKRVNEDGCRLSLKRPSEIATNLQLHYRIFDEHRRLSALAVS